SHASLNGWGRSDRAGDGEHLRHRAERTPLDPETRREHLHHHQVGGGRVVAVHDELRLPEMRTGLAAKPTNDGPPTRLASASRKPARLRGHGGGAPRPWALPVARDSARPFRPTRRTGSRRGGSRHGLGRRRGTGPALDGATLPSHGTILTRRIATVDSFRPP